MRIEELEAEAGAGTAIHGDERLRLIFACAHPAIDAGARAPLILQTMLGFDAADDRLGLPGLAGRMGQRLVRAKTQDPRRRHPLRACRRRPSCPSGSMRCWTRSTPSSPRAGPIPPAPIRKSPRPGRGGDLAGAAAHRRLPDEPETTGLVALMLYAEARRGARRYADGRFHSPVRTGHAALGTAA